MLYTNSYGDCHPRLYSCTPIWELWNTSKSRLFYLSCWTRFSIPFKIPKQIRNDMVKLIQYFRGLRFGRLNMLYTNSYYEDYHPRLYCIRSFGTRYYLLHNKFRFKYLIFSFYNSYFFFRQTIKLINHLVNLVLVVFDFSLLCIAVHTPIFSKLSQVALP